ncbi:unnamed protein product, partial [Echinostoma caproni]|uniref:Rap-GAP domain-containing protein n=1 Tax=Echinostoma caproni TaxID=27848 RepID=A0A183AJY9_9TREM
AKTVDKTACNTVIKLSGRENGIALDTRSDPADNRASSSNVGSGNTFDSPNTDPTLHNRAVDETDDADDEEVDADINLGAKTAESSGDAQTGLKMSSRWSTRVFAVSCVRILISACARAAHMAATSPNSTLISLAPTANTDSVSPVDDVANSDDAALTPSTPRGLSDPNSVAHFDLALARCLRQSTNPPGSSDWLVLHLADLIRMAFMSATSDCEPLRMAGLRLMRDVIQHFASVPDPDCVATQPSPELTSVACQVCSMWIGSGVARDPNDLQRVHELLRRAFDKMQAAHLRLPIDPVPRSSPVNYRGSQSIATDQLYCEDAVTMEQLAVLRSWADVYIVTMRYGYLSGKNKIDSEQEQSEGIGILEQGRSDGEEEDECDAKEAVEDEVGEELFYDARQRFNDDCLVTMTFRDGTECPTMTDRPSRRHYRRAYHMLSNIVRPVLPSLAQAWIAVLQDYALLTLPEELANQRPANGGTFFGSDANIDRLCLEALSGASEKQSVHVINTCLRAMWCLLSRPVPRSLLMRVVPEMPVELLSVLYRLLLTRDTIQTHLLCLQNVSQVLIAAEERLVKQREVWLSKDSPGEQPRALLTPDAHNTVHKSSGINMVSSVMLQTTSLVDAEMYELAEGGSLASFPATQDMNGTQPDQATKDVIPCIGLQPGRSVVFACLEIVMCVLARYRPALLAQLRAKECAPNGTSACDMRNTIPETRCSDSSDAPFVLAAAIRCCTFVPDLCAPSLLLSTLDLISGSRTADSSTPSKTARVVGKDNLLPVFLDLVVQLAQICLINPGRANFSTAVAQTTASGHVHRPDPTDLPELQRFMSVSTSNGGKDDSEISSTTACSSTNQTGAQHRRRAHERQQHRLIRWTWQQSELADALSSLIHKLAQHHYPALALSTSVTHNGELDETSGKTSFGQVQPDSSSNGSTVNAKSSSDSADVNTKPNNSFASSVHNPPADKRAQAATQWYELVSMALLKILRHEHARSNGTTSSSCCFASVALVSRIVADCPARVLHYEPLRTELCSRLHQLWSRAGRHGGTTPPSDAVLHEAAWIGLSDRYVCMVAISALISHRDPVVSAFFVRTLTPQIFRWLHDLSYMGSECQSTKDKSNQTHSAPISRDDLTNTLHLAMEVLESVIDLSDAVNRPNLLVILVPLWCSLLCPSPPAATLVHQWTRASHCLPRSAELACGVHLIALQHLVALAPRFPTEFRSVFGALGAELRTRLERAIRQSHGTYNGPNKLVPTAVSSTDSAVRPVIQLKTDFSGFDK